ncbi:MAG TPA: L,D-transpeptidase [Candidatus Udaeobacter sp.]|jgi:lipoprotein-anchoring transpeptidase ErfK/SrfK|nr:L,D-transpeptidase [Candidatus Udaeobacter sp.]
MKLDFSRVITNMCWVASLFSKERGSVRIFVTVVFLGLAQFAAGAATPLSADVFVSVPDQTLALIDHGKLLARYPISTSKFGNGDSAASYRTPLGTLFVSAKIGDRLPPGAVIKNRIPTGEVVGVDAPGRDAIVARVIWLRGMETQNQKARDRCIYIHGTPEERRIGKPASFGCIRMRSRDIIDLYDRVHIGTHVTITLRRIDSLVKPEEPSLLARSD